MEKLAALINGENVLNGENGERDMDDFDANYRVFYDEDNFVM